MDTCTLTTACFCSHNPSHVARSLEETVDAANALMSIPVYLVIFGDKDTIPLLRKKREDAGLLDKTVFYEIKKSDIWSFQYIDKVRQNRKLYHPTHDPRHDDEIHLLQCNKADFVLQTIAQNPFNTRRFGWTDAFLGKDTIRICEDYHPNVLSQILESITDDKFHIQVLNVCDKKYKLPENKCEYYSQYQWVACGGFYICGADIGKRILTRLKDIFVETTEMGYGHGEEMLYLEILDEFEDDIVKSYGDYGQMWNNFIKPIKNVHYVYWMIFRRYVDFGYNKEASICGRAIVDAITPYCKNGNIDQRILHEFGLDHFMLMDIMTNI